MLKYAYRYLHLIYGTLSAIMAISSLSSCVANQSGDNKSSKQEGGKPNVLFIAVDDLRPDLGIYNNDLVQTPHIDRMAQKAMVFDRHYVQVPTCGASRYALMTGYRPRSRRHLANNIFEKEMVGQPLTDQPESFVHQLRRHGYRTIGIGKLSHSADGLVYGYEEQASEIKEMPHSWDEFHLNSGKWGTGWNAFFGYADGENRQSLRRQVKPYEAGEVDDEGYVDGLTTDLAIRKLQELQNREEPFFLGVGYFKPHLPFNAPKRYWDLYDRAEIPMAPDPNIPEEVSHASLHDSGELNGYRLTDEKASLSEALSPEYSKKLVHAYYASISYIDAQVGRLIAELQDLDLAYNTIIVIWGDHGWHLGNSKVWGKHTLFERSLRSALIIKVPYADGGRTESIVETVDIYPTLLDLCGVEYNEAIDGHSFKSILLDHTDTQNQVAYSYFKNGISVRNERYRLTKYNRVQEPTIELYDHNVDPYETRNIAALYPDVVAELLPILEIGDTGLYN